MVRGAWCVVQAALLSREFQHLLHHGPDPVVDVVECGLTHEGRGGDHLVFLVYVSFVGTLGKI